MEGRKEGKAAREDQMRGGLYSMRGGGAGFSCAGRLLVGGPACPAAAGAAASDLLQVLRVVSCAASDLRGLQV